MGVRNARCTYYLPMCILLVYNTYKWKNDLNYFDRENTSGWAYLLQSQTTTTSKMNERGKNKCRYKYNEYRYVSIDL